MKCINCDEEAEYLLRGHSLCKKHMDELHPDKKKDIVKIKEEDKNKKFDKNATIEFLKGMSRGVDEFLGVKK